MAKKTKLPVKFIVPTVAVAIIGFVIVDFFGCTLKEGVPMDTTNTNDFIYGDATPFFCNISNLFDSEALGFLVDEYVFGGTEPVDLFEFPFDEALQEIVVEDPNGEIGLGDPEDVLIDKDQFTELEMLQNQTTTTDPLIGEDVTEILPPELEPLPEEITPMLVDISFITEVTKIATDGTQEVDTSEFQFIPFELFVEDTTNKDFSNGRFITILKIKSEPNIFIQGSGQFEVLLDNQTLSTEKTPIKFSGTTDANGELSIDFISPTGLTSNDFLLNVLPLTSQINARGLTPLEFKISNVIATAFNVDYTVSDGTVFLFNFFRDPNQILVIDSQGIELKGFPTDDQLIIGAVSGSVKISSCYKHSRYSCWMTRIGYRTIGSPTIAGIEVRNSNGDLVLQNITPFTTFQVKDLITRNDTYTVNYGRITSSAGSLPAGSFSFTTPEVQKNYNYYCTIAQASVAVGSGFCRSCLIPSGVPYLTCNFPK